MFLPNYCKWRQMERVCCSMCHQASENLTNYICFFVQKASFSSSTQPWRTYAEMTLPTVWIRPSFTLIPLSLFLFALNNTIPTTISSLLNLLHNNLKFSCFVSLSSSFLNTQHSHLLVCKICQLFSFPIIVPKFSVPYTLTAKLHFALSFPNLWFFQFRLFTATGMKYVNSTFTVILFITDITNYVDNPTQAHFSIIGWMVVYARMQGTM